MKNPENIKLKAQDSSGNEIKEKIIDKIIENGFFTKYPLFITTSIITCFIANGLILNIFNLIIIPAKKYFNASDFTTQITAGILFIGLSIGSGIASLLSEKYGRARVIKILSFIMFITYLISTIFFNIFFFFIIKNYFRLYSRYN